MKKDKPKIYIASCSFGKDSLATILLALENNEPLDRVVFAEVMFDHSRNISGEMPEHIEWVYNTAIPKLESMGVKVDVIRGKRDLIYFFTTQITKGKLKGKYNGFPIGGKCFINRDCKTRTVGKYLKALEETYEVIQYIGIASDETNRLQRLGSNKISLLDKYNFTQTDCINKCKEYDLLSPTYSINKRGGCFFCPNASMAEYIHLKKNHRDLWEELRKLSKQPNLASYKFRREKTFDEIDNRIDIIEEINEKQIKLF